MDARSTPQEFFVAGGTLWREAPSYIHRPADEELFRLALDTADTFSPITDEERQELRRRAQGLRPFFELTPA